ncbi:hypothetical protein PVK62_06615 [Aliivibrio sp. S3MY1]|uniref:hypothetical protein n=1 Tax=unclassified Aliivibrio TaxID=2645654 RepID=UPI00237882E6|nr:MULTISPECIES: hypothetical protein [unclassified Aliivibrio]MDD9195510.1 hypothetical protein [Aliivibrio sp. S3MY1]MDD9198805.1 hypothetical protein [Aliivibrio sp. S2MY1]
MNTQREAMSGRAVDYLLKPVIFSRLEEAINKYLSQKLPFIHRVDIDQTMVNAMLHSITTAPVARLPNGTLRRNPIF